MTFPSFLDRIPSFLDVYPTFLDVIVSDLAFALRLCTLFSPAEVGLVDLNCSNVQMPHAMSRNQAMTTLREP